MVVLSNLVWGVSLAARSPKQLARTRPPTHRFLLQHWEGVAVLVWAEKCLFAVLTSPNTFLGRRMIGKNRDRHMTGTNQYWRLFSSRNVDTLSTVGVQWWSSWQQVLVSGVSLESSRLTC